MAKMHHASALGIPETAANPVVPQASVDLPDPEAGIPDGHPLDVHAIPPASSADGTANVKLESDDFALGATVGTKGAASRPFPG